VYGGESVGVKRVSKKVVAVLVFAVVFLVIIAAIGGDSDSDNVLYSQDVILSPDEMKNITLSVPEDGVITVKYEFKGPTALLVAIKQNGDYLEAKDARELEYKTVKGSISANVKAGDVEVVLLNAANVIETPVTYHIEVVFEKGG